MKKSKKERQKETKKGVTLLIVSAAILTALIILVLLFKNFPDFFFPGYRTFSKWFMGSLAKLYSFMPYAAWDWIETGLIVGFIISLIILIAKKKNFAKWLGGWMLFASIVAFIVVGGWMLNHYGPSLSEEMGLEVTLYTKEQLAEATAYYTEKASDYALLIERNEDNTLKEQDLKELAEAAGKSYEGLAETYPVFEGCTLPVKLLTVFSEYLLYRGNTGEFMPFTGESSVPQGNPVIDNAFTMAHEAAHRLAIASEEDCNFAAFLACEASDDVRFLYSGYYSAFIYCYNALYSADYSVLQSVLNNIESEGFDLLIFDSDCAYEEYQKYEGPVQEVSEKVNDSYLKTFSVEEGVKSYGEVVNDLIAWYLENYSE